MISVLSAISSQYVLQLVSTFWFDFVSFLLCMQQFPIVSLNIVHSVLFVGYMEPIFWLFPMQLLRDGSNFLCSRFHLIRVSFLFSFRLNDIFHLKIVFKGGFVQAEIIFILITSIVWFYFSLVKNIDSKAILF